MIELLCFCAGAVCVEAVRRTYAWYQSRQLWTQIRTVVNRPLTPEEQERSDEYAAAFQQMVAMHNRLELLNPDIASAEDVFATWQSLRRSKTRLLELTRLRRNDP